MRKLILLYILIVIGISVSAQKYIDYNLRVLDAQLHLMNQDFDSALLVYKDAFTMVEKPFPKDFENAALTAYYLDSIGLMENYIRYSIKVGSCYQPIKKKFKRDCGNNKFWKEMEDLSEGYIEKTETQNDTIFFILKEMLVNDQKARKSIFHKKEKMQIVDSINTIKLNNILKERAIPGFITIGIFSSTNQIVITDILMLHIPVDNYEQVIVDAVINGELTPNIALYIYIRQYKYAVNANICPTFIPYEIRKCTPKYESEGYEKLQKMGFDFNGIL